jgi:hypothetical protein
MKKEMCRIYGTYGAEERCIQGFSVEKPEGKRPLGSPRLRWGDEIKHGSSKRIDLAQNRDGWRTVANVVINRRVM